MKKRNIALLGALAFAQLSNAATDPASQLIRSVDTWIKSLNKVSQITTEALDATDQVKGGGFKACRTQYLKNSKSTCKACSTVADCEVKAIAKLWALRLNCMNQTQETLDKSTWCKPIGGCSNVAACISKALETIDILFDPLRKLVSSEGIIIKGAGLAGNTAKKKAVTAMRPLLAKLESTDRFTTSLKRVFDELKKPSK